MNAENKIRQQDVIGFYKSPLNLSHFFYLLITNLFSKENDYFFFLLISREPYYSK